MKTHFFTPVLKTLIAGCVLALTCLAPSAWADPPDLSTKTPFVAVPLPGKTYYNISIGGKDQPVPLYGHPRAFDFANSPFINPTTGVNDIAVMLAWDPAGGVLSGKNLTNAGMPGHIEWDPNWNPKWNQEIPDTRPSGRLMLAVLAGDQIVTSGTCRAQVASYGVPSGKTFYWDYIVQFGETEPVDRQWVFTNPGVSPVLITQLKALDAVNPSLSFYVDTDQDSSGKMIPGKLLLSFSWKGGKATKAINVGKIHGIDPHTPVEIIMEAYLDERELPATGWANGYGYLRAWARVKKEDGTWGWTMAYNPQTSGPNLDKTKTGPTLTSGVTNPHQWMLDAYLYNDRCPNKSFNRYVFFERAKMLTD